MNSDIVRKYAREMRNNPTKAEAHLWKYLRKRNLMILRFLRQFIIYHKDASGKTTYYIADFYCSELKLIVEVDGDYHNKPEQLKQDEIRTSVIKAKDFFIIRFSNNEVLFDTESVIRRLSEYIQDIDKGCVSFFLLLATIFI